MISSHAPLRILQERWAYLVLAGALLALDRWSKLMVAETFQPGASLTVIPGFFELVHVRNTGIAFGLLASVSSPLKVFVLSGFAVAAAALIIVYSLYSPARNRLLQSALALAFAGALGNAYDRMAYGHVIDFLSFHIGEYYWPAFNVADAAISTGVVLLLGEAFRDENRNRA